ncbi:uncharacterized protein VTP21DRAFT_10837 [Calcarisporiella thermophila]|uniref:uncharacterized protein n=1 Tax=Calcarisporiella thermophila TaxID=911321 RepID=UPI003743BE07
MPLPKLQWLNIKVTDTSPSPSPRRDFAMVYDAKFNMIALFGGRSEAGIPLGDTWLFETKQLVWSRPAPSGLSTDGDPPARWGMAYGLDNPLDNSRNNMIISMGQGVNNVALNDTWAFDFNYKTWHRLPTSGDAPTPRWGVVSGIDISQAKNPNQTMLVSHGMDSKNTYTELYSLTISGQFATNVASMSATWKKLETSGNAPGRKFTAGTILSNNRLTLYGGCIGNNLDTCPLQDGYVLNTSPNGNTWTKAENCFAPRAYAAMTYNPSTKDPQFSNQVFVYGGVGLQQLDNGQEGEVGVLDVGGGRWNIILPSGDPLVQGASKYPPRRAGAALVALDQPLGNSSLPAYDMFLFGGEDLPAKGSKRTGMSSDIWVLRVYSDAYFEGNNTGMPTTGGVAATGQGVNLQLFPCVSNVPENSDTGSSTKVSGITSELGQHATLMALSMVFLPLATTAVRFFSGEHKAAFKFGALLLYAAAIGTAIAGGLQGHSDQSSISTHGALGIAVLVLSLGVAPLLTAFMVLIHSIQRRRKANLSPMSFDVSNWLSSLRPSHRAPQKSFEVSRPGGTGSLLPASSTNTSRTVASQNGARKSVNFEDYSGHQRETSANQSAISAYSVYSSQLDPGSSDVLSTPWKVARTIVKLIVYASVALAICFELYSLFVLHADHTWFYLYLVFVLVILVAWFVAAWFGYPRFQGSWLVAMMETCGGRGQGRDQFRGEEMSEATGPYTRRDYEPPRRGYMGQEPEMDEEEQQRELEEEVNSRDVVVMTIPKRRLTVVNA